MNYLSPCPLPADESVVTAWDSELRRIKTPWIEQILAEQGQELFQRFTTSYNEIRALPRTVRRALQRNLARSEDAAIPADWRRRLAYSIAGAALLIALGQTISEAKGPKPIKLSTKCSLYNAIYAAEYANTTGYPVTKKSYSYSGCQASPGPTIIALPKNASISASYLPPISGNITIQGVAAKKPKKGQPPPPPGTGGRITGNSIFFVNDGGSLTLQNVTVQGSSSVYNGGAIYNAGSVSIVDSVISGTAPIGGAIFNSGNLSLNHSNVSNSTADYGGGIYNIGNLTVTNNSTITGNHANYDGGGIDNAYSATITNSTISTNTAARNGGGIAIGVPYGRLSIGSSTLTGNSAFKGGSLHNAHTLIATSITISNSNANYGGGLFNDDQADAVITSSTVSGNHATVSPSVYNNKTYYVGGYGGGINNHGGLTINSSTINGTNTAEGKYVAYSQSNYGGKGGGIHNSSYIYLNGSSVTGNTALFVAGGIYNLPPPDATLQINNSTISGNTAAAHADVYP